MSEVVNKKPLEKLIHQSFHDLADKYGVDVDKVAEIVESFLAIMGDRLERRVAPKQLKALHSKTGAFRRIIEVNAPVRFYWHWNGFDGIEVSIDVSRFTRRQRELLLEIFDAIEPHIEDSDGNTPVPSPFLRAFRQGKE